MIIVMQAGVKPVGSRVQAVVSKAKAAGLNPVVEGVKGKRYGIVQIFLKDGPKVKSCSVAGHIFQGMLGVDTVQRVTPPQVSLAHQGDEPEYHKIRLDNTYVGTGLPCRLIAGPCTVDRYIGRIASQLASLGVRFLRGGCWKPRSRPYSFRGYGDQAAEWLLQAARDSHMRAVFTEVIESPQIEVVRKMKRKVGYHGAVVLWVGARTANPILLAALGAQKEFPVMVKNSLKAEGISDLLADRAEWVLAQPHFDRNGSRDSRHCTVGNDQIILCLRGTEQTDPRSPWRGVPNHHWADLLRRESWAPVAIDVSHSAGRRELVFQNLEDALRHHPSLVMVEGGYPNSGFGSNHHIGHCDQDQMISIEDMPRVISQVSTHNEIEYHLEGTF